jgi:hypothetical protein
MTDRQPATVTTAAETRRLNVDLNLKLRNADFYGSSHIAPPTYRRQGLSSRVKQVYDRRNSKSDS